MIRLHVDLRMLNLKHGDLLRWKAVLPEELDENCRVYHLILAKDGEGYKHLFFSLESLERGGGLGHTKNSSHPFYNSEYWEKIN